MKRLILIAILLLVGGGCGGEPERYYTSAQQSDQDMNWNHRYSHSTKLMYKQRVVGVFDTYAEASKECKRLNGVFDTWEMPGAVVGDTIIIPLSRGKWVHLSRDSLAVMVVVEGSVDGSVVWGVEQNE